jgi:predicted MFS family arabinose efflux permease
MKSTSENFLGRATLLISHVGGMVDLVALPLWISGLIASAHFLPQKAGALVSLYIFGVMISNIVLAPRFMRLNGRIAATAGFAISAACFFILTHVSGFPPFAALHLLAGLGAGAGLSCVHGTIGRSKNPHRLFAIVNIGVCVFGIIFFATVPHLLETIGVNIVFIILGSLMVAAALACALAFPPVNEVPKRATYSGPIASKLSARVFAFAGVAFMTAAQSAMFGFVQQVGMAHGFAASTIGLLLAGTAFLNLVAPVLAGILQHKLPPTPVAMTGVFLHGCASLVICDTLGFTPFAIAAGSLVFLTIFSHIFMFGFISRIDRSGRMAALTPSMLMVGTAIGPFLAGTVVGAYGYHALGLTAAALAWISAGCYFATGIGARDFMALPLGVPDAAE